MTLTPAMEAFILHWGEMGSKWGVNRSVAQIHALLHLSPEPLPAETISELLGLARSNVSTGLKELQGWKLVQIERRLGDRRDHFTSIRDMFDLVHVVIAGRREREYLPTLQAVADTIQNARADGTPDACQARMQETYEVMDLFDRWYRDVQRLPRPVQKALLRLGAGITKLLPSKLL